MPMYFERVRAPLDLASLAVFTSPMIPCRSARAVGLMVRTTDAANAFSAQSALVTEEDAGTNNQTAGGNAVMGTQGLLTGGQAQGGLWTIALPVPTFGLPIPWKWAKFTVTGHATNIITGFEAWVAVWYDDDYVRAFDLARFNSYKV